MNESTVHAWIQETVRYWRSELAYCERELSARDGARKCMDDEEARVRRFMATRFLNQLAELEKEMNRGQ